MFPAFRVPRMKACLACASAKAKCEAGLDYTKCKRCSLQGIECAVRDVTSRKRRKPGEKDYNRILVGTSTPCSTSSLFSDVELSNAMTYYRTTLFCYCPFVVLPNVLEIDKLKLGKPFLALVVVMLGSTKDRDRQCGLAIECRKYLAFHVIENGEKSLDLVQGLLLLVHWYHFQSELADQKSVFLHILVAMVDNLKLSFGPCLPPRWRNATDLATRLNLDVKSIPDHCVDEKRAFLGCLYLTSVMSQCGMNLDASRCSQYDNRCCEELEASELASDRDLARLVRLQRILDHIEVYRSLLSQGPSVETFGFGAAYSLDSQPFEADPLGFIDRWSKVLDFFWCSVPHNSRTVLLSIQHEYARLCLYEIIIDEHVTFSPRDRLLILHKCLQTVKSLHKSLLTLTLDPVSFLDMPYHLFGESNHSVFVAVQLGLVRCDGWDSGSVEDELNMTDTMNTATRKLEHILGTRPRREIPEYFRALEHRGRKIRIWYDTNVKASRDRHDGARAETMGRGWDEIDFDFLGQFLHLDDSMWLQSMLGEGESVDIGYN
ncbi:hypothetical protein B0J11DRAFT_124114 [Dendryphion nanum]|uniref:Zn(2)-C6 fungal-type domain-containing protein n=1 Tax=Dendryphion nanum TaxID=256645 RepID=A0A9P9D993_9PLEO|nr:hypothetical protein B0J11DRAFT_124114 [Dendryphion nanum]